VDERPVTAEFLLRRGRGLHLESRAGFKTVRLNHVGWSALAGAGLVLGTVVWLISDLPLIVTLPAGVFVTWAFLVGLDHRRWRNSTRHICRDDMTAETGQVIVDQLSQQGIEATYRETFFDEEDGGGSQRGIVCRNADYAIVRRVMDEQLGRGGAPL
jgi:hypothetical protein